MIDFVLITLGLAIVVGVLVCTTHFLFEVCLAIRGAWRIRRLRRKWARETRIYESVHGPHCWIRKEQE